MELRVQFSAGSIFSGSVLEMGGATGIESTYLINSIQKYLSIRPINYLLFLSLFIYLLDKYLELVKFIVKILSKFVKFSLDRYLELIKFTEK